MNIKTNAARTLVIHTLGANVLVFPNTCSLSLVFIYYWFITLLFPHWKLKPHQKFLLVTLQTILEMASKWRQINKAISKNRIKVCKVGHVCVMLCKHLALSWICMRLSRARDMEKHHKVVERPILLQTVTIFKTAVYFRWYNISLRYIFLLFLLLRNIYWCIWQKFVCVSIVTLQVGLSMNFHY